MYIKLDDKEKSAHAIESNNIIDNKSFRVRQAQKYQTRHSNLDKVIQFRHIENQGNKPDINSVHLASYKHGTVNFMNTSDCVSGYPENCRSKAMLISVDNPQFKLQFIITTQKAMKDSLELITQSIQLCDKKKLSSNHQHLVDELYQKEEFIRILLIKLQNQLLSS